MLLFYSIATDTKLTRLRIFSWKTQMGKMKSRNKTEAHPTQMMIVSGDSHDLEPETLEGCAGQVPHYPERVLCCQGHIAHGTVLCPLLQTLSAHGQVTKVSPGLRLHETPFPAQQPVH